MMDWINKSQFSDLEEIEFKLTEETSKEDIAILNKIFSTNKSFSGKISLNHKFGEEGQRFFDWIKNKNIRFYRCKYELQEKPKDEKDNAIFNVLSDWSKAKNNETIWNYWYAYNFFVGRGYILNKISVTNMFMHLSQGDKTTFLKKFTRYRYSYDYNNPVAHDANIEEDASIYEGRVRCGYVRFDRIITELMDGLKSLWIFPSNPENNLVEGKYAYCYLMTVDKNLIFYTQRFFGINFLQ